MHRLFYRKKGNEMKNRLRIGIAGPLCLLGVGCTMLPIQNTLKAMDSSKGSLQISVTGASRSTQARLTDIDHVLFTLQSVKAADATKSLDFAQLTQGGASGSVTFRNLWPGNATISATVYGSNPIRTQGMALLEPIGSATATATVVSGIITQVPLNIKMDNTQTQAGGLTINLGIQAGDEKVLPMQYKVTTLAGSTQGYNDASGIAAQFNNTYGIATDATGNVFVADGGNSRIRKVTPGGMVTTIAGSGACSSNNGTGTAASFNNPDGVAVDTAGNVYVADFAMVRKITPANVVSTLASGFSCNGGIAVDATGNLYVTCGTNIIRKITPANVVTIIAGSGSYGSADGTGSAASFSTPIGIAVDAAGYLYVADFNGNKIRKVTPDGVVTTLAGSGSSGSNNGTGTAATFNGPRGIAVDAMGNVFVADRYNNMIRKITSAGVVTTIAGRTTSGNADGTGTAAQFNNPFSVAVDAMGRVYVADTYNYRIRMLAY